MHGENKVYRLSNGSMCFDFNDRINIVCDKTKCRHWIDYEGDSNCSLVCANRNPGGLSLREAAERLHISFPRVKQIQDKAMEKAIKRGLFDFMEEQ
jgi:hypothetical protein